MYCVASVNVCYPNGQAGFPSLVRTIVEHGGDLLACDTDEASFDEVFHTLLAGRAEPATTP